MHVILAEFWTSKNLLRSRLIRVGSLITFLALAKFGYFYIVVFEAAYFAESGAVRLGQLFGVCSSNFSLKFKQIQPSIFRISRISSIPLSKNPDQLFSVM
jgi:hypothetical protein